MMIRHESDPTGCRFGGYHDAALMCEPPRVIPPGSDCICGRYQDERHRPDCPKVKSK